MFLELVFTRSILIFVKNTLPNNKFIRLPNAAASDTIGQREERDIETARIYRENARDGTRERERERASQREGAR